MIAAANVSGVPPQLIDHLQCWAVGIGNRARISGDSGARGTRGERADALDDHHGPVIDKAIRRITEMRSLGERREAETASGACVYQQGLHQS